MLFCAGVMAVALMATVPIMAQEGSFRKDGGSGGGMEASSSTMQILFSSDWEFARWESSVPEWPTFYVNAMSYEVTVTVTVPSGWQVDVNKTYCYYGDGTGEYMPYFASLGLWRSTHTFQWPLMEEVVCLVTRTDTNQVEHAYAWISNLTEGDENSLPTLPPIIEAPATGSQAYDKIIDQYEIGNTSSLSPVIFCPGCSVYTPCSSWSEYTELTTDVAPNLGGQCDSTCRICNNI